MFKVALSFLFWVSAVSSLTAGSYILPVEAIEDSKYLSYEEFKADYPGIPFSGKYLSDHGYYVHYTHQKLDYYFGPIEELDEAKYFLNTLNEIVEGAISQRRSLASSRVELWRFTEEGAARVNSDGTEEPVVSEASSAESNPSAGLGEENEAAATDGEAAAEAGEEAEESSAESEPSSSDSSVESESSAGEQSSDDENENESQQEEPSFSWFDVLKRVFSF